MRKDAFLALGLEETNKKHIKIIIHCGFQSMLGWKPEEQRTFQNVCKEAEVERASGQGTC